MQTGANEFLRNFHEASTISFEATDVMLAFHGHLDKISDVVSSSEHVAALTSEQNNDLVDPRLVHLQH